MSNMYVEKTIFGKTDKWLELSKLKLKSLPENFKCPGSLSCEGSSLAELPVGLTVQGNLYIGDCNITKLPSKLIVGGDLILLNSSIFDLPSDICIGGNVIALQANNIPQYKKNTEYNNFVCDKDGHIIPFIGKKTILSDGPTLGQTRVKPIILYLGVFPHHDAVAYKNPEIKIFSCASMSEGRDIINKDNLKQSEYYKKYFDYDVDQKRFVKELKVIFQQVGDSCDQGIEEFFKIYPDLLPTNKYSIRETNSILQNMKDVPTEWRQSITLFDDYFFHREKFENI